MMISNSLHEKYSNYRCCIVQECKNTSIKTPEKLWISVPSETNKRNTWLRLAQRDPKSLSILSQMYFCEDHFDLENDMENYMQYKIMGSVKRIRIKPGCVPSRFECQSDRKHKRCPTPDHLLEHAYTKRLVKPISENIKPVYPIVISTSSLCQDNRFIMATSVCRVCLVSNTRMLNIDNIHLLEMYKKLTNTELHSEIENGMPSTVCYVCHRLLQKCHRFSHVAHKSNRILQDLLLNGTEVTQNMVTIQSQSLHNLSVTVTNNVSINIDTDTGSTAETIKEEQEDVDVEGEEETNAIDEIVIEEMKLEMPDEFIEFDNISNNTEPSDGRPDMAYTEKSTLKTHMLVHTGKKSHSCHICDEAFNCKNRLASHMIVHTGEKPYSCSRCDKVFTQKSSLKKHMLVHTGEKPYSCSTCDKAFSEKSNLTKHMLVHTGEKPYSCSTCDKAFSEKSSLTKHMLIHTGEKPYSSSTCDKVFSEKSNLTKHMLVHTREKPYSCSRCDKAFNFKSRLASHMIVHTGEKTYSCSRCAKAFTRKSSLTKHMLVHTGEKPYSCSTCDKAFSEKSNLTKHIMLVHTGEQSYSCSRCDKAYTYKSSWTKHMLVHALEENHIPAADVI